MAPRELPEATKNSYRSTFQSPDSASGYDDHVYAQDSSAEILWSVEKDTLVREVAAFVGRRNGIRLLDFACGTGRILATLEPFAEEAVGVDISAFMLERASLTVKAATLIHADITQPGSPLEGKFDLITAFRFLTNAEESLRRQAAEALAKRLRDGDSLLIINTHGNLWSYRLLSLPYHWIKDRLHGRSLYGYITTRHAVRILEDSGLRVEKIIGMGFFPQKLLHLVPPRFARWLEHGLAGAPFVQRFGLNQMIFCRLQ